jgi:UDP-glucose 4-epimerase
MRIIITGALGHIGSYIIRDFVIKFPNIQFVLLDNMMTQRFTSLYNLPNNGQYKFIETDIINFDLESLITKNDILIHLAAITDAAGSFDKAQELEDNNFNATRKVAISCLNKGAKLISLSSTSVYGTQNLLVSEDCSPEELRPQSPYATTKLKEEDFILDLCKKNNLNAVIFRFGTIFGVSNGMRFHTAVNKFCWQAVMKQPITVWKTAYDQKRPYLDLKDASNAFAHVIVNNIFDGEIYNVLTLNATVRQIVDSIKRNIKDLNIEYVDNKIMNQLSYEVTNTKFKNTGFNFEGNLDRSIDNTLNLLKNSNNFIF